MISVCKRGFTLLELLVVIGMIMIITGAMTVAVSGAHERTRIQKAQADVKSVTQAVLGYENYAGDLGEHTMEDKPISKDSIGFLLGKAEKSKEYKNVQIPALLMAALSSSGEMRDPWGTPYRITIREKQVSIGDTVGTRSMSTSYAVPNFYNLTKGDRQ